MKALSFAAGDTVRLTGVFLRNTGQIAGGEGQSRWRVQALIPVAGGKEHLVLTDELRPDDGMFTAEEMAADDTLRYRRIRACNLEKCRAK